MKTFAIGIPTINRWDLLESSLDRYVFGDFRGIKIFIVDNGSQCIVDHVTQHYPADTVSVLLPSENLGVAGSWNELCYRIFKEHDHALILNDDIYLGRTELDILQLLNDPSNTSTGFFKGLMDWCAFIISKDTFAKVGDFDTGFFPAYYEDNDYAYRMELADIKQTASKVLTPSVFNRSMTIKKSPELNNRFMDNRLRYQRKWAGLPGSEVFETPFNSK